MAYAADVLNLQLVFQHIAGATNEVADRISRGNFRGLDPALRTTQTPQALRAAVMIPFGASLMLP